MYYSTIALTHRHALRRATCWHICLAAALAYALPLAAALAANPRRRPCRHTALAAAARAAATLAAAAPTASHTAKAATRVAAAALIAAAVLPVRPRLRQPNKPLPSTPANRSQATSSVCSRRGSGGHSPHLSTRQSRRRSRKD